MQKYTTMTATPISTPAYKMHHIHELARVKMGYTDLSCFSTTSLAIHPVSVEFKLMGGQEFALSPPCVLPMSATDAAIASLFGIEESPTNIFITNEDIILPDAGQVRHHF